MLVAMNKLSAAAEMPSIPTRVGDSASLRGAGGGGKKACLLKSYDTMFVNVDGDT